VIAPFDHGQSAALSVKLEFSNILKHL